MATIFDQIVGIFDDKNKKKKKENTTVQSQAVAQEKPTAKQTNFDRLKSAREKVGGKSLASNTGALYFGDAGKSLDTAAKRRSLKGPEDYETYARGEGYTDQDIAYAKQAWQNQYDQLKREWDANPNPVKNVNPDKAMNDNWTEFLPKQGKQNLLERTYNDIKVGALTNQMGTEGLSTAVGDLIGNEEGVQRSLDRQRYMQGVIEQANQGNPQTMYDRILTNAVNNGINAARTAGFGALGAVNDVAKAAGLANMGLNVFGNAYGQVRSGMKGEQYQDDTGAALRYGLANAGSELAQELVDPFHFVPGADTPTLGNFFGEMGQEAFGAVLDPYLESVLDYNPLTQTEDWAKAIGQTAMDQHFDENGNWNPMKTFNRGKDIALQGFEGGIGGVAGGAVTNPVQTAQQFGADIRSIQNAKNAQDAINFYDNALADQQAGERGFFKEFAEPMKNVARKNQEASIGAMRSYVQDGLRSGSENYRKVAGEANRRVAEYTGREAGMKETDINNMVDISNRLGVGLEFAKANDAVLNGRDAVYQDGKIIINAEASNPYETLFAHEMAHSAEGSNDYQSYKERLDDLVRQGIVDDIALTDEERYAVLTENLLSDKRTLQDVADYDDSTLKYLVGQIKDTMTGNAANKALNKTMRALNGAIEQAKYQNRDRTEYYTKKALAEAYPVSDEGKQNYRSRILPDEVAKFIHGYDTTPNRARREAEKIIKLARENGGLDEDILADYVDEQIERDPDYSMIDVSDYEQVENLSKVWEDYTNFFTEEGRAEMLAEETANEIIQRAEQEGEKKEKPKEEPKPVEEVKPAEEANPVQEEKKAEPKPETPSVNTNTLQGALQKNLKILPEHVNAVVEAMDNNGGKADPALIDKLVSEGVTELNKQIINRLNAAYDYYNDSRIFSGEKKKKEISEVEKTEQEEDTERRKAINPMSEELQKRINSLKQKGDQISDESNKLNKVKGANFYVLDNGEFTGETVKDVLKGLAKSFNRDYALISPSRSAAEIEEIMGSLERMYEDYQDVKQNGYDSKYFKEMGLTLASKNANSNLHKELKQEAEQWLALDEDERLDRQDRRESIVYGKLFEESEAWKNMSDAEKLEATRRAMREAIEEEPEVVEETPVAEPEAKPTEEAETPVEQEVEESYDPDSMYEDDYDEEAIAAAEAEAQAEEEAKAEEAEKPKKEEKKPTGRDKAEKNPKPLKNAGKEIEIDAKALADLYKGAGVSDEVSEMLANDYGTNYSEAKKKFWKESGLGYTAIDKIFKDTKRIYEEGLSKGESIDTIREKIGVQVEKAKAADKVAKEKAQAKRESAKQKPKAKAKETKTETKAEETKEAPKEKKGRTYKNKTAYEQAQAEAKAEEEKQNKAADEYLKDVHDARNYSEDFSTRQTAENLRKAGVFGPELEAVVNEGYHEKEVRHDKDVRSLAGKWYAEEGIPGAVEYAKMISDGKMGATAESVEYFKKALTDANKIAQQTQAAVDKFLDYAQDKGFEVDNEKGTITKDGKNFESIKMSNGETVTFKEFEKLKEISNKARTDGDAILDGLTTAGTEAGRLLRYMRFMYPGNQVRGNKLINNFIEALKKEHGKVLEKKGIELTVSDKLREDFINAANAEERRKAMEAIEDELARQIPATKSEKLRQWRMFNMLANPRTHIRNFVSNAFTTGMFTMTDITQRYVENELVKKGILSEEDRLTSNRKKGANYKDYTAFAKQIRTETGYTDDVASNKFDLSRARMRLGAFSNRNPLGKLHNTLSKANSKALQWEDDLFVSARADKAMAMMLHGQGYEIQEKDGKMVAVKDGKKISDEALDNIIEKARKSAEEATYHDFNKIANYINNFKRNHEVLGTAVDVVVPFTKTPANILKRTYEYTPLNLAQSLTYNLDRVAKGKMSASEAATQLSRGLTGTAAQAVCVALGLMFRNYGIISTPDDDDEEKKYYKQNIFGKQDYALHIGDKYYSLDWAYPSVVPLVQGAQIADAIMEKSNNPLEAIGKVGMAEIESFVPILQASYLQSVADLIDSAQQGFNYGGEITSGGIAGAGERIATGVVENMAGQMVPTIGGAINRTFDPVKRTTSGNTAAERIRNRFYMNVPGLSGNLEPAIDQKGNVIEYGDIGERVFNNFINPSTVTYDTHDKLDEELMSVGKAALPKTQTGQGGLKSSIKTDLRENFKKTIGDLSDKDYTKVKQTYYGNYHKYVKDYNELADYNNIGKTVRNGVYEKLEKLALAEAKLSYYDKVGGNPNKLLTDEQKAALALKDQGVSPAQFYLMKENGLSGNRKGLYTYQELEGMGAIDNVVNDIKKGKYSASSVGLTESILKKTALERDDAMRDFLSEDNEYLESQAATYRLQKGTDEYEALQELKKSKDSAKHLDKLNDDIYTQTAKQEFFEDRAIKAGLSGVQFYEYQDIKGTDGVSSSRAIKVMEKMKTDGTWDSYKDAYINGEIDKNDLSKLHLSESMMKWTDDALNKAIASLNDGTWTDMTDFKSAYKKATGVSVEGKASGSSSSSKKSSSSSKTTEERELESLFKKALSGSGSSSSSGVKTDIKDSAALFDKIVNSSKADVEKLRRELRL